MVLLAGVTPIVARAIGGAITLTRVLMPLAVQFRIVTLIFVILDRNKGRLLDKWDPRRLPALKANPEDGPNAQDIFTFTAVAVGMLWLVLTPLWPCLLLGPGALYLQAIPMKLHAAVDRVLLGDHCVALRATGIAILQIVPVAATPSGPNYGSDLERRWPVHRCSLVT